MSNIVSTWQPTNTAITMTAAAMTHVDKQLKKQGHGIGVRLGIKKSGCSGYAYVVTLIDEVNQDEATFSVGKELIIAVANQDLPLLQGTEIDYVKEGLNQHFKFNNPNEKASCGCGESVSFK